MVEQQNPQQTVPQPLPRHHAREPAINFNEVMSQVGDISRRMRIIEERYDTLRKKTQLTDQNVIGSNRKIFSEIKSTNDELVELRRDINDIKDKIKLIIAELKSCAKTEQVKVLEKYINIWEPVNFVTQKQVKKLIDDAIEEKLKK